MSNKKDFCQACHNDRFGIRTKLFVPHTCNISNPVKKQFTMQDLQAVKKIFDEKAIPKFDQEAFNSVLTKAMSRAKEQCIIGVLKQLLKREPSIEDAKKCTLISVNGISSDCTLAYENIPIGIIRTNYSLGEYSVYFTPNDCFK